MYLSHFGLNEPPFCITPHTDFFFAGASRGATLGALIYAITHDEGIVKVSGEVGSGKTMLCRVLVERLPENIETIYLANPSMSRQEIVHAIADELKVELAASRTTRLQRELQDHLIKLFSAGRRVVLLIDEAHAMPRETLEEVRLLSNLETGRQKLLQIVLFGQPELDEQLSSADLRQLKERITHSFRLEPMVMSDIGSYIDFRMRAAGYRGPNVFSSRAIRMIAASSEGLTRRINILADKSLLAAFAHNTHSVGKVEARAAIRDSDFYKPRMRHQKFRLAAAAVGAGAIIGWSLHWLAPGSPGGTSVDAGSRQSPLLNIEPRPHPVLAAIRAEEASVAQKPAAREQAAASFSNRPAPPSAQGSLSIERPAAVSVALGDMTRERFTATQAWLKTAPGNRYAVQLITVKAAEPKRMEDFLLKASKLVDPSQLYVYSVKIDGQQHYRAAYGLFASTRETQAAIQELPPLLKSQKPYQRSVERMRSQNRQ